MSSNNNAENTIMSNNFPSLCIPRVYPNIKEDRIRRIFQELALGELDRIDIVNKTSEKGEKFNRVFVHFKTWYTEGNAEVARKRLIEGKDIKIMYDDPWFWKVSAYKERVQKPLPEKKPVKAKVTLIIESDDEEEPAVKRDDRRPQHDDRRLRDDSRFYDNHRQANYDNRRSVQYHDQRPNYDERGFQYDYYGRRPQYHDQRPAQYHDQRPKPNEGFKKTKKEDFNNIIAPTLSENNGPYRQPLAKALPLQTELLALKPKEVLEPVVVKEELPVVVKEEPLGFTAFEPPLIKITPENAKQYIGECVTFKHDGKCIIKRIESVSETGKSIRVDYPEVENSLQIVTRNVYLLNGAIIPEPLMKPRAIKTKEQKEKEKKASQLLVKHAFSPEV